MLQNTVANVFKIILIAIIVGVAYSISIVAIDGFTSTNRYQDVAKYLTQDIAKHNCLLYETYVYASEELVDISNKSAYMSTYDNSHKTVTGTSVKNQSYKSLYGTVMKGSPRRGISLYNETQGKSFANNPEKLASLQDYIQTSQKASSQILWSGDSAPVLGAEKYGVGQYGDILTLQINIRFAPQALFWNAADGDGQTQVNDLGWVLLGAMDIPLTYKIPCLSYVK